jgi:hypothetical protein
MDVHAMVDFCTLHIYKTQHQNINSVTPGARLYKNEMWLFYNQTI